MKDHIQDYKSKLEKALCSYMEGPATERSAEVIRHMIKCWHKLDELQTSMYSEKSTKWFTRSDAEAWAAGLKNDDGSTGPHWAIEQTTAVADSIGLEFDHVSDWCWWITMNMMYSDYCDTAMKFGVGTPEFFAELAKDFLFDMDGPEPECKLAMYYFNIVKHK